MEDQELTEEEKKILSAIFHIADEILISIDMLDDWLDNFSRDDLYSIAKKLGIDRY